MLCTGDTIFLLKIRSQIFLHPCIVITIFKAAAYYPFVCSSKQKEILYILFDTCLLLPPRFTAIEFWPEGKRHRQNSMLLLLWQWYNDVMCFISAQGGAGAGLGDMFGQLDLGSEEGEDQLMKMMQGMMSTLLSKEVLYPSLKELCKQASHPELSK